MLCTFVIILNGASSVAPGGVLVTFTTRYSPVLGGTDGFLGEWLATFSAGEVFLDVFGDAVAEWEEHVLE